MCISHSVMEGQRHNNPLNPRYSGGIAKALGGSYASAKNCKGDDSTAQGNTKEWGQTNKSKCTNGHQKHKPRLSIEKHTSRPATHAARVYATDVRHYRRLMPPRRGLNKQASETAASGYVTVTLMTFDKQSNGRRIA